MSNELTLFCKSYRLDLKRVIRLSNSIDKFNVDNLPFVISVPEEDRQLFVDHLYKSNVLIINDEDVISKNPNINIGRYKSLPGNISQQVVKSEFWRLNSTETYMCLDSDAIFIRPIQKKSFIAPDGFPYTVMDEAHEFLEFALLHNKTNIVNSFMHDIGMVQSIFQREGRTYSFAPFPLLWHRDVWESLDLNYFRPNRISIVEAIEKAGTESHWYGEALLKFKAIPLYPCQPLFKVYHYAWQYDKEMRIGVKKDNISKIYHGIIYQSAWERNMDWPREGGFWTSHIARRMRRILGRV